MAYEIDTASGYLDLQARIEAFATAQGWTVERSTYDETNGTDGELILSGPGLGGGEAIVVGIRSYSEAGSDRWNFALRGFDAFDGSAWDNLPRPSDELYLPLWDTSIPYWLMVNGQRILLMAKVSTYYMHAYLGFVSTYATSEEYPYPLLIAGCTDNDTYNYQDVGNLSAYWSGEQSGHGEWLKPGGAWQGLSSSTGGAFIWPWPTTRLPEREGIGTYVLLPATLLQASTFDSTRGVVGELDGVMWVSEFGAGVEDTVTVGTQDYVVGQNVEQSSFRDMCALELS